MGGRSGWTRQASHLITDPVDTEVVLLEAGASSVGAGAGAVVSPEVSATCGDEVGGIASFSVFLFSWLLSSFTKRH